MLNMEEGENKDHGEKAHEIDPTSNEKDGEPNGSSAAVAGNDDDADAFKPKLTFSLGRRKPTKMSNVNSTSLEEAFETDRNAEAKAKRIQEQFIHQEPLVIPVQKDSRQSLRERTRQRQLEEQKEMEDSEIPIKKEPEDYGGDDNIKREADAKPPATVKKEEVDDNRRVVKQEEKAKLDDDDDQAAVRALQAQANGQDDASRSKNSDMIIGSNVQDTFQRGGGLGDDTDLFRQDIQRLAPELQVDSEAYQTVPIHQFGAAMLRGMGWSGSTAEQDDSRTSSLPRPSRLGLGAIPKMPETLSSGRQRPRRQDQVQRDERLKEQAKEYQRQQEELLKNDKQRTMQVGSIVSIVGSSKRAVIRQLQGVPGLNMIRVQYEGSDHESLSKVKKGEVELIERDALQANPFQEPVEKMNRSFASSSNLDRKRSSKDRQSKQDDDNDGDRSDRNTADRKRSRSERGSQSDQDDYHYSLNGRRRNHDSDRHRGVRDRSDETSTSRRRRDRSDKSYHNDERHRSERRSKDRESDRDRYDRRRDKDRDIKSWRDKNRDNNKSRSEEAASAFSKRTRRLNEVSDNHGPTSWLIPNIRVRIVTTKLGSEHYKQKGLVMDVTRNGTATVNMDDHNATTTTTSTVLHVPERHLETALPKVGGNAIILTGPHRLVKGKLLERDSRNNKGSIQAFDDLSIVELSLDDMAEWCGPLDDDLM